MKKLKKVIEQYGRWAVLSIYVERIETYIESDFSLCVENSKALLESIAKQICKEKGVVLIGNESINKLVKISFEAIGFEKRDPINTIATSLSAIAQQIGNLRTSIGSTSHGKSLDELERRNQNMDFLTNEFLISSIEIVSCFLIRNFENENPRKPAESVDETLDYYEAEEFNEFWDNLFGEFEMGDYSYPASEILFYVDNQVYKNEYNAFITTETIEE
ncbi:abortive infection family protein [Anaerorudis cellulosivorans]|uniref:abortive infection family protein n=1 Tax=Anaerorudis cellulosivorans TaxID=3397862 RepID=UPI002220EEB9|nr:abortive infection family protein [Seramator thermalis]MCW1734261.1 abortive infection family protein [Seramator thermalis]